MHEEKGGTGPRKKGYGEGDGRHREHGRGAYGEW